MSKPKLSLVCLLLAAFAACDSGTDPNDPNDPDNPSPDAPSAACVNLSGQWEITGQCGVDLCTITQVGCAITQVSCVSGSRSTSGDIDGASFTYTGTSGGGVPSTCSGSLVGNELQGSCTSTAGSCNFTGDRP